MSRRFRTGDIVRVIGRLSIPDQFTVGQIYTVRGIREYDGDEYYTVMIEEDDSGSRTNGWGHDYFELVAEAPPEAAPPPVPMQEITFYTIIYLRTDGTITSRGFTDIDQLENWKRIYLDNPDLGGLGRELARKKIKTNIPVVEN